MHLIVLQNKSAELVASLARKRKRDHFKDVRANFFCASLLRTQIHMPCTSARAKSQNKQMIGQMAIARALPEFNDLGHTVTPIFLLIDHFLY